MSDALTEGLAAFDAELEAGEPTAADPAGTVEETPVEEPAAEAEAQTEEAPAEELILGRFKTPDDLAKSYQELEREFGRRNEEWAELKQLREEMAGFRDQQAQAFESQTFALTAPQLIQQHLEQGDYQAAADVAARIPDGGNVYQQVTSTWRQDDPQGFNSYQMMLRAEQAVQAVQEQTARAAAAASEAQMQQAFTEFARTHPDLDQLAPEMLKVAESSPKILQLLEDSDPATRIEVLDYLHTKARERVSGIVTNAATKAAEEQQLEAAAAKRDATVASPTQRVEAETTSPTDAWLAEFFDPYAEQYMG